MTIGRAGEVVGGRQECNCDVSMLCIHLKGAKYTGEDETMDTIRPVSVCWTSRLANRCFCTRGSRLSNHAAGSRPRHEQANRRACQVGLAGETRRTIRRGTWGARGVGRTWGKDLANAANGWQRQGQRQGHGQNSIQVQKLHVQRSGRSRPAATRRTRCAAGIAPNG